MEDLRDKGCIYVLKDYLGGRGISVDTYPCIRPFSCKCFKVDISPFVHNLFFVRLSKPRNFIDIPYSRKILICMFHRKHVLGLQQPYQSYPSNLDRYCLTLSDSQSHLESITCVQLFSMARRSRPCPFRLLLCTIFRSGAIFLGYC